jgi:hypothetical protein
MEIKKNSFTEHEILELTNTSAMLTNREKALINTLINAQFQALYNVVTNSASGRAYAQSIDGDVWLFFYNQMIQNINMGKIMSSCNDYAIYPNSKEE